MRTRSGGKWAGIMLGALVCAFLLFDASRAFLMPASLRGEMAATGWPLWAAPLLGSISLVAAVLLALPRTALLGAIWVTGFLGGAIATHLRLGEVGSFPQIVSLAVGVAAWAGLWLRDPRFRALVGSGG